jgi:hypothetical protein
VEDPRITPARLTTRGAGFFGGSVPVRRRGTAAASADIMRLHVHAVALVSVAFFVAACGLRAVGGEERDEETPPASVPSNVVTRGPTPPCSACDAGSTDGGAPSAPALACDSYRSCPSQQQCCYEPTTGSHCAKTCELGALSLCRLGVDGCGEDHDCMTMPAPPAGGIGVCVED